MLAETIFLQLDKPNVYEGACITTVVLKRSSDISIDLASVLLVNYPSKILQ